MKEREQEPQDIKTRNGGRKRLVIKLAMLFALAGASYAYYWNFYAQYSETTDNAYLTGNLVYIEPQITGTVVSINGDDTDFVEKGTPIVILDDTDSTIAFEKAKAELADSVRQTAHLFEDVRQYQANVALRESELKKARDDYNRRESLKGNRVVSEEDYEHAWTEMKSAEHALQMAHHQLAGAKTLAGGGSVANHPSVMLAKNNVRQAYLALKRTMILAPISGYVAKRSVQIGQRVNPGDRLMAIVPPEEVWVEANFKESQLASMRVGQPAKVTADMYGKEIVFNGTIAGIGAGTGGVFSILPPQNATGNWIKVVQRVPVRINLERQNVPRYPLILGLSMRVTVSTRDRGGNSLKNTERAKKSYQTDVYESEMEPVDDLVNGIIMENLNGGKTKTCC